MEEAERCDRLAIMSEGKLIIDGTPEELKREIGGDVLLVKAEDIADLLDSSKYINEFLIAKKLNITINQTRNILYKMSDHGLVSSMRKKDKRKGWYTYFWKIELVRSLEFLKDIFEKKMEQINNQIKSREIKEFYVCERCNIEFNEENALTNNFTCNECGGVFSIKDNTKLLKELRKNSERLKKELEFVDEEIRKEKEKVEGKKLRDIKKEERKKAKDKKLAKKKKLKEKPIKMKKKQKPLMKKSKKSKKKTKTFKNIKKSAKKKTIKKKTSKKRRK